jgi:hypothetical protein
MKQISSQLYIKLLFIPIVFILVSNSLFAQQLITIGNGSATNSNIPFNGYYDYSWSSTIYKQSEMMGMVGSIESISFHASATLSN